MRSAPCQGACTLSVCMSTAHIWPNPTETAWALHGKDRHFFRLPLHLRTEKRVFVFTDLSWCLGWWGHSRPNYPWPFPTKTWDKRSWHRVMGVNLRASDVNIFSGAMQHALWLCCGDCLDYSITSDFRYLAMRVLCWWKLAFLFCQLKWP